ncbi:hypothetical protein JZO78_15670 [Enterococcus ureilyticus]|uniref:hypothetical protein n=1 Tax=Enterococcus ureilyticus TaxID=1131292 RepID=UPI001A926220|nr:hypothetical protein [Enterococcus ureilyticus]MBO0447770.1 hypothetical protein [Enterococcus ureilyticus]
MTEKKLSGSVIDTYNKDTITAITDIVDSYTSAKKTADKVEALFEECSITPRNNITEIYTLDTLESDLEDLAKTIKTKLDKAKSDAQNNDAMIKAKMTERSAEVKQLKSIINQYKGNIASASSLNASGLASGLKAIGKMNNIDKIPGVSEGRGKRLEQTLNGFAHKGVLLTEEEMLKEIRKHYRNLSDEDIAEVLKYYMHQAKELSGKDVDNKKALLVIENGKYKVKYVDLENNITFFNFETSADANLLNPSASLGKNVKAGTEGSMSSGFGANASMGVNMVQGDTGNMKYSIGNASGSASINQKGAEVTLGANLAEFNFEYIFSEDDLYRYKAGIDVSVLSAEIKYKLATEGIEIGTPGLLGISVSGGRVELIDINMDL